MSEPPPDEVSQTLRAGRLPSLVCSRRFMALVLASALVARPAAAWIYPEHRDIMAEALRRLLPEHQRLIAELWASARVGRESRYCTGEAADDGRVRPTCIDLVAWPAIAGDHSCSPEEFLGKVLTSDWILKVARVAAETKIGLEKAATRDARLNEVASSNLKLQRVDPQYASRAEANNGHFLITRTSADPIDYLKRALAADAEPNALGLYLYYHLGAVGLAREWVGMSDARSRSELARRVLATETFAIHFLEDMFAAGHVAGSWGDVAERKGTHDYYSEFGLDTENWNHESIVVLGDANMRPDDLARAGTAVAQSLSQLLTAFQGDTSGTPAAPSTAAAEGATRFDSCTATKEPSTQIAPELLSASAAVLAQTPMPGMAETDVHLPRFRQEIGPFVGFAADLIGGGSFGGFEAPDAAPRGVAAGEIGFRVGVGLEALTGSTGAGQAFLGVGFRCEASQGASEEIATAGIPRVPSRHGYSVRMRVPFYLIPLDLIPATLVLSWASPGTLTNMAIVAASGGLLGWHRSFNTPIGAFQFLLGRDVGVIFFGYVGDRIETLAAAPPEATLPYEGTRAAFISYRSLMVDFPSFEYRPLRTFSTKQALTFALQIGWGVEFPNQVRYESRLTIPAATGPTPGLGMAWHLYFRIHIDTRYYF